MENIFYIGEKTKAAYSSAVPWLLRIVFVLLVFSVPFETMETSVTTGTFSLAKMIGWAFLLTALFYPKNSFRHFSYITWMFLLYLLIYFLYGLYQDADLQPVIIARTLTLLQMIVLLWIGQNLLVDTGTAHLVLFSLGVSTALMSALQLLGITSTQLIQAKGRMSALAEDPNSLAAVSALGFLSLMGLAFYSSSASKVLKIVVLPLMALILTTIVQTGSRGGMIGLLVGILIFSVHKQRKHAYVKNIAIVSIAILTLVVVASSDATMWNRFRLTFEKGSFAQREKIVPTALEMIEEKPIIGWGPFTNYAELGRRLNYPSRDTHNLFLLVLTEVGIIGSIPYFIGLAGSVRKAWNARSMVNTILPLALVACLFVINMGISWHNRKLHWLVLAYCIASSPLQLNPKKDSLS